MKQKGQTIFINTFSQPCITSLSINIQYRVTTRAEKTLRITWTEKKTLMKYSTLQAHVRPTVTQSDVIHCTDTCIACRARRVTGYKVVASEERFISNVK